jgi:hypothetical protein
MTVNHVEGQLEQAAGELERATSGVPKVIGPKAHAVLDYLTAGAFFTAGFAMRKRNSNASALAFANGAAVLGASMITDYPGGVWPLISFRVHGLIDVMQAALAAAGPSLFGFANEPEGQLFHAQAAVETGVVSATNFNAA